MNSKRLGKQRRKVAKKKSTLLQEKFTQSPKNVNLWDKENYHRKRPKFQVLKKSVCYKILSVPNTYKVLVLKNESEKKLLSNPGLRVCRFCSDECLCVKMKDEKFESFMFDNFNFLQSKKCHMRYMRKVPLNDKNLSSTDVVAETMESDNKINRCGQVNQNLQVATIPPNGTKSTCDIKSNILCKKNTDNCNDRLLLPNISVCPTSQNGFPLKKEPETEIKADKELNFNPGKGCDLLNQKDYVKGIGDIKDLASNGTWLTFFLTKEDKTIVSEHKITEESGFDKFSTSPKKSSSLVSRRNSDSPCGTILEKSATINSRRHSDRPFSVFTEKINSLVSQLYSENPHGTFHENSSVVSEKNSDVCTIPAKSDAEDIRYRDRLLEESFHKKPVIVDSCKFSDNSCDIIACATKQTRSNQPTDKQTHQACHALKSTSQNDLFEKLGETVKDSPVMFSSSQSSAPKLHNTADQKPSSSDSPKVTNNELKIVYITDLLEEKFCSDKLADPRLHPEVILKRKAKTKEISLKRVKYVDNIFPSPSTNKSKVKVDSSFSFRVMPSLQVNNIEQSNTTSNPKAATLTNKVLDPRIKYSKLLSANPAAYRLKEKSSKIQVSETSAPAQNTSSSKLSVKSRVHGSTASQKYSHSITALSLESTGITASSKLIVKSKVSGSSEMTLNHKYTPSEDKSVKKSLCFTSSPQSKEKQRPLTPPVIEKSAITSLHVSSETETISSGDSNTSVTDKSIKKIVPSLSRKQEKRTNSHFTSPKIHNHKYVVPKKKARYSSLPNPSSSNKCGINISSVQSASRRVLSLEIVDFNSTSALNEINVAVSSNGETTLNKVFMSEKFRCPQSSCDISKKINFTRRTALSAKTQSTGRRRLDKRLWKKQKLKGFKASSKQRKGSNFYSNKVCSEVSSNAKEPKYFRYPHPISKAPNTTIPPGYIYNKNSVHAQTALQKHSKSLSKFRSFKKKCSKGSCKSVVNTSNKWIEHLKNQSKSSLVNKFNKSALPNSVPMFDFKVEDFMEKVLYNSAKPRYFNLKPSILWYKTLRMPLKLANRLTWECCLHFVCSQSQSESTTKLSSAMDLFDLYLQNSFSIHLMKHSNSGLLGVMKYFAARAIKLYNLMSKNKKSLKKKCLNPLNNFMDTPMMFDNDSSLKNVQELTQQDLTNHPLVYCKSESTECSNEVILAKENIPILNIWSKKNMEWKKCFGGSKLNCFNYEYFDINSTTFQLDKKNALFQNLICSYYLTKSESLVQRKSVFMFQDQFHYNKDNENEIYMTYNFPKLYSTVFPFQKVTDFYSKNMSEPSARDHLQNKNCLLQKDSTSFWKELISSCQVMEDIQEKETLKLISMYDEYSNNVLKWKTVNHSKKEFEIKEEDLENKVNFNPPDVINAQLSTSERELCIDCDVTYPNSCDSIISPADNLVNKCNSPPIGTKDHLSVPEAESSDASDCITFVNPPDSMAIAAKESNYNSLPIGGNEHLSTSEKQSNGNGITALVNSRDTEVNSVLSIMTIHEKNAIKIPGLEEVVENSNGLLHSSLQGQGVLNFNEQKNDLCFKQTDKIGSIPLENELQCKENQNKICQDLFCSLASYLADHHEKEDSSGSMVTNSNTLFTSVAENDVPSPLEVSSLLLASLWDGFEYPLETTEISPPYQVPWTESTPQTVTLVPNTVAQKQTGLQRTVSEVSKTMLPSNNDTVLSNAVQKDEMPHHSPKISGKFLTSKLKGTTRTHTAQKKASSTSCSNKISAKLWKVPSIKHYPSKTKQLKTLLKTNIISTKNASTKRSLSVAEELKIQKKRKCLPCHPSAVNQLNSESFKKIQDYVYLDEILPNSTCESENFSSSSTCESEGSLLLNSVNETEISTNAELSIANCEQENISPFHSAFGIPECPMLLSLLDPGVSFNPGFDTISPPEIVNSDVFQTDCYLKNEKPDMCVEILSSAFHDFNLFGEGKPMQRYYQHLRGIGNHTLNLSRISKDKSDLSGDLLESYNFLNDQVEYHKSLLRGLVHFASEPNTNCGMKYMERIATQLEYIEGYELACSALLL